MTPSFRCYQHLLLLRQQQREGGAGGGEVAVFSRRGQGAGGIGNRFEGKLLKSICTELKKPYRPKK